MKNHCLLCKASLNPTSGRWFCSNCKDSYLQIEIDIFDESPPLLTKVRRDLLSTKRAWKSDSQEVNSGQFNFKSKSTRIINDEEEEEENSFRSSEDRTSLDELIWMDGLQSRSKKKMKKRSSESKGKSSEKKEFRQSSFEYSEIGKNDLRGIFEPEIREFLSVPANQLEDRFTNASQSTSKVTPKKKERSDIKPGGFDDDDDDFIPKSGRKARKIIILDNDDVDSPIEFEEKDSPLLMKRSKRVLSVNDISLPSSPAKSKSIEKEHRNDENIITNELINNEKASLEPLNSLPSHPDSQTRSNTQQSMQLEQAVVANTDVIKKGRRSIPQQGKSVKKATKQNNLPPASEQNGSQILKPVLPAQSEFLVRLDEIEAIKFSSIDTKVYEMAEDFVKFDLSMTRINRVKLDMWLRELDFKIPELFLEVVKDRELSKKWLSET